MEVLDLIYHQFFFTANSLECQPSISQFFQPLALQPLVLVATAIHFAQSEYASGNVDKVMFCPNDYWSTFCTSPLITFALGNYCTHQSYICGPLHTPCPMWHNSARIGSPDFPIGTPSPQLTVFYFVSRLILAFLALLSLDGSSLILSVWIGTLLFHSAHNTPLSMLCSQDSGRTLMTSSTHWSGLWLQFFIPHCFPLVCCGTSLVGYGIYNHHHTNFEMIGAPLFHSMLNTPPFRCISGSRGAPLLG